jgi:hypothetical protein
VFIWIIFAIEMVDFLTVSFETNPGTHPHHDRSGELTRMGLADKLNRLCRIFQFIRQPRSVIVKA